MALSKSELYKGLGNISVGFNRLKPEQKICVEFSNYLKEKTIEGKLPFIWFHVPNEFYRDKLGKGGYFGAILSSMGRISGVADYCFVGNGNSFFIEFKTKYGKLSENQEFFRQWCEDKGVEFFICRSAEDGIEIVESKIL